MVKSPYPVINAKELAMVNLSSPKKVEAETQYIREMRRHTNEKMFTVGDLVSQAAHACRVFGPRAAAWKLNTHKCHFKVFIIHCHIKSQSLNPVHIWFTMKISQ